MTDPFIGVVKIGRTYELRHHGGARPTWRPAAATTRGQEPIARSVRRETNRQIKKQRLMFA